MALRDLYLNKSHEVLTELKLINPIIRDQGVLCNLMTGIKDNLKLKSLTISGLELESKCVDSLIAIIDLKAACL